MYKKLIITLLIILILLLGAIMYFLISFHSLGAGHQDFTKGITGGYDLYRTSDHTIFIAPKDVWSGEDAIIPEKVLRLNDYREFIIAERQGLKRRSPDDSLDMYLIPDSTIMDYWILDTKKKTVIGSMSKQGFEEKLDSLNIPKAIELIDVYKY